MPMWTSEDGVIIGLSSGNLLNVTKNKLKMDIPDKGASLYRNLEGVIQFLTSFKSGATGTGHGFRDAETYDVFKNGRIDMHNKTLEGEISRACFSDSVSCKLYRNGQEVP